MFAEIKNPKQKFLDLLQDTIDCINAKNLVPFMEEYLYFVYGPVSSGKSMFMRQMADQIAQMEVPVVYLSWDMTKHGPYPQSNNGRGHFRTSGSGIDPAGKPRIKNIANHLFTIEGKVDTTIEDVEESIDMIFLFEPEEEKSEKTEGTCVFAYIRIVTGCWDGFPSFSINKKHYSYLLNRRGKLYTC
ncbi:hypothetical protein [Aneurinibacillus terranovensis]|uniref:hypothetical protein n=1 Tax=Aneurinibacillus terranovensis TaxID=278991 RepID=UPI0003F6CA30|nr:hypothetical protein [Aneurinibacillus terranovensis]